MRFFNKKGLINIGFPYYGWLTAIQTVPPSVAMKFGINLIFYGEDGEKRARNMQNRIIGLKQTSVCITS